MVERDAEFPVAFDGIVVQKATKKTRKRDRCGRLILNRQNFGQSVTCVLVDHDNAGVKYRKHMYS
jgi:hypothetical protein